MGSKIRYFNSLQAQRLNDQFQEELVKACNEIRGGAYTYIEYDSWLLSVVANVDLEMISGCMDYNDSHIADQLIKLLTHGMREDALDLVKAIDPNLSKKIGGDQFDYFKKVLNHEDSIKESVNLVCRSNDHKLCLEIANWIKSSAYSLDSHVIYQAYYGMNSYNRKIFEFILNDIKSKEPVLEWFSNKESVQSSFNQFYNYYSWYFKNIFWKEYLPGPNKKELYFEVVRNIENLERILEFLLTNDYCLENFDEKYNYLKDESEKISKELSNIKGTEFQEEKCEPVVVKKDARIINRDYVHRCPRCDAIMYFSFNSWNCPECGGIFKNEDIQ